MVCNRCIMVVRSTLEKAEFDVRSISLGEVELNRQPSPREMEHLKNQLESLGFSIIDDAKSKLIEKTKSLIVELVHQENGELKVNLSDYLSQKLDQDYRNVTKLFTEVEGITIEKYFIAQKVEKVKELLVYGELTLSEIAYQLNYSSVAHLSNQFKKVTGLTPSHFKQIKTQKRKPLDEV